MGGLINRDRLERARGARRERERGERAYVEEGKNGIVFLPMGHCVFRKAS